MLAFRIQRLVKWQGNAFCDVAVGTEEGGAFQGVLSIRGVFLAQKKDGTGMYFKFPSKPRIKDGEQVVVDGYKVYDPHVDLFLEQRGDKSAPSKAAFRFKDALLEALVAAYERDGQGRGSQPTSLARAAAAKKPAASARKGAEGQSRRSWAADAREREEA